MTDPKGDGSLPGALLVSGKGVSDFPVTGLVQVPVPDGLTAMLWAGRRLEDLSSKMDMVAVGTPKADMIEKEMTDISVGYGLASRVMSLVAVVERIGDQAGVQPQQKIVAVGIPEGMENPFAEQRTSGSLKGASRGRLGSMLRSRGVSSAAPGVYGNTSASVMSFAGQPTSFMDAEPSRGFSANFLSLGNSSSSDFLGAQVTTTLDPWQAVMSCTNDNDDLRGAAACGTAPHDPDDWSFTGSLLTDLAALRADGGLPGHTLEERVQNTLLLALILAQAAQQTFGVYDKHLDRMLAFLEAHKDLLGDKIATHKVIKAIQKRVCPVAVPALTVLFQATLPDVLQALRTSL